MLPASQTSPPTWKKIMLMTGPCWYLRRHPLLPDSCRVGGSIAAAGGHAADGHALGASQPQQIQDIDHRAPGSVFRTFCLLRDGVKFPYTYAYSCLLYTSPSPRD